MEVKPRYKQTEVGLIPEDWGVASLGMLVQITSGESPSHFSFLSEGAPYFKVEQLGSSEKYLDSTSTPYHFAGSRTVPGGSVVFAKRGAAIALNRVRILREASFMDTNLMALTPLEDLNAEYLYYMLGYVGLWQFADTTSVPQINNKHVKPLPFVLPPLSEQRAIVNALSDMDALLDGLDRLITKKRAIKQATMQQLLTGQTRLPGFSGEWKVRRLEDALAIKHGKSQKDVEANDGAYPILATGGQIGLASQPIYGKPSVLIGRKGTINQPQYMDKPFWSVDTLFYSEMKNGNIAKFFYYRFCLIDWMQYNEASGVPSLNARTIESIECACPDPEEQAAIAEVLSDVDTEIAALETRRTKTRALKQAMMQELLTGRTRLV
ncbi:restriction endonuclease subunit S [Stutzerimonas stutzeri]|uniref:restriction endonuclease subunit S n=1 Tax=Stutzerimonas stutzeri TaxID=316 RepID=UPI001CFE7CF0|nr:restriction endonuclease subunit S [Stutzerimonas stutzeri]